MEPAGSCLKFSHFYVARMPSTAFLICPAAKASLRILSLQGPPSHGGGGLWEAAVRALKLQLKKVVGTHVLTHEQLTTVIAEVEAIRNSRPLIPIALDDSSVPAALTPGHFLIGRPNLTPPIRWSRHTNQLFEEVETHSVYHLIFWKAWSSSYLQSLQARQKWTNSTPNFRVGDLVLLCDDMIETGHLESLQLSTLVQMIWSGSWR